MSLRTPLVAGVVLISLLWPSGMPAQAPPSDPGLAKGIRQVEEGDLEGAVETLTVAVKDLSADPLRGKELAQAHLYLGTAYALLDQEKAARASFREALRADRQIRIREDTSAPKVRKLFDAVLQEMGPVATPTPHEATPTPAATPRPVHSPQGKAIVYIYYPERGFLDPGHPVYLDEKEVAKLAPKSYLVAKIDPGTHFLRSRNKKDMIQIQLSPGDTQFFELYLIRAGLAVRMVIRPATSQQAALMMLLKPTPRRNIKNASIVIPDARFPYVEAKTP